MPSKLSPLCAARVFAGVTNLISVLLISSAASAQQMPVVEAFARDFDPAVFLAGGEAFAFDLETLRALPAEGDILVAGFPLPEKLAADLLLHRINPRKPGALSVVVDQFGRELPMPQPETHFFGGSVAGIDGSGAFIGISPAGVFGWIETPESRYMITSGPFANPHAPAVFDMASEAFSAIELEPFQCEYLAVPGSSEGGVSGGESFLPNCRQIDLALDTDQEFLGKFGGNTAAALGYIQTLVAGGDEIYRRDNAIQLRIAYTRLWSVSDPWTQTSTSSQLPEFRNYWNANMGSISRDVAHLLSGRSLGGGIAWLNAICTDYGYAVDANMSGSFPTPLTNNAGANWDIMVFTHELGHNCGTPHTHDFCPPVDRCAPSSSFGQCQNSQTCINTGTLMSYCHLCSGGLANMVLQFHPTCVTSITNYMNGAGCSGITTCTSNPACVLTVSSAAANYPVSGGSATVNVTTLATGCAWTPLAVPSWITLTNPGPASGNGSFSYTVQANTGPNQRTHAIAIGDLVHVITQASFFDCNGNGTNDSIEIAGNPALDCDGDGILNSCEIAGGASDCDANGVPDSCQVTTPVAAWGAGTPGTSGNPNYGQSTVPANLGAIKAIAAGSYHSLALRTTGSVAAWGFNAFGQSTVPADLAGIVAIAGGGNHSMALSNTGVVTCWGLNDEGQCSVPVTLGIATAIAAGNGHSVALKSDGTVACWGDDLLGQATTPPGTTGITAIAAGFVHTLALRSDGTIAAWGQDNYGQATPPAGAAPATSIVAGAAHSVARRADGSIVCFGNNTFGQSTPPADLGAVQRVFAGGYCTAAIRADGTVRVWGRNDFGQASLPAAVTRADVVAMGVAHSVSLSTVSQLSDCDEDGVADACEIQGGAPDTNSNGIPDTCENLRPADLDGDGGVNGADLALLLGNWGAASGLGDINGDGARDGADLALLLGDWG